MPWTLYKHVMMELLKLLTLAAGVLMLVVSMGAALRPLMEGLLDPASLAKFVVLTSPAMLQFALPFAAAFASTLFYARMTSDNEVVACSAGGMSYVSILLPVFFLGVVLMLGLFVLGNTVAPAFNRRAAGVVQKDVIRVMVTELKKGRAFVAPGKRLVIYADAAEEKEPSAEQVMQLAAAGMTPAPTRLIVLRNVAVSRMDKNGTILREGTARAANVFLFQDGVKTYAMAYLAEVTYFDPIRGDQMYVQASEVMRFGLPGLLKDKPELLSRGELLELMDHPERFDRVATARQRLVDAIGQAKLMQQVYMGLVGEENVRKGTSAEKGGDFGGVHAGMSGGMSGGASGGASGGTSGGVMLMGVGEERYRLWGPVVKKIGGKVVLESDSGVPVRVEMQEGDRVIRWFEARRVEVSSRMQELDGEPRVMVELSDAKVFDARLAGRGTEHPNLALPPMRWEEPVTMGLETKAVEGLLTEAEGMYGNEEGVRKALISLRQEVGTLTRKVIAQLNLRGASAFTCMLVLVLGAVLAMRCKGRSPLWVFLWSFLATLGVIIIANSGATLCGAKAVHPAVGVMVLWLGNALLMAAVAIIYLRLSRN